MYEFNYGKFPLIYDVFNYKKICNKNTLHSKYNTNKCTCIIYRK